MKKRISPKKKIVIRKKYDLKDLMDAVEKHFKKNPNLDVVKWMEKNGR